MSSLFYLAYGGAEITVFDSQVLTLINRVQTEGIKTQLVIFHDWKDFLFNRSYVQRKKKECRDAGGLDPIFLPRAPRDFLGINSFNLRRLLNHDNAPKLIHARGAQGAYLACQMKTNRPQTKVLFDCRGLEAEEYLMIVEKEKNRRPTSGDRQWFNRLKKMEAQAARQADHIFCVSQTLKERFLKNYGVKADKIDVIPCCMEESRFQTPNAQRQASRQKLGIENRLVLTFAGSVRAWQPALWLAKTFQSAKKADPSCFLLVLTPARNQTIAILKEHGVNAADFHVLTTDHRTTPQYLNAGDIGILLRENHPVNEVACPTKTAEYLAAGNLLITTPHPKDIAHLIKTENAGSVILSPDDQPGIENAIRYLSGMIRGQGDALRNRINQVAKNHFSWNRYLPTILRRYQELSS
ncbi:MAG: glycosyltransferase [Elusimicrobia bacterium]|nr:glycosyltransferase [Elusimicrobiota bacterium]